jgi:hypothetical protein
MNKNLKNKKNKIVEFLQSDDTWLRRPPADHHHFRMPLMTDTYQTHQQSPKWTINSKGIKAIT